MRSANVHLISLGHALGAASAKIKEAHTIKVKFANGELIEVAPASFGPDWIFGEVIPTVGDRRNEYVSLAHAIRAYIEE